jgi:formyl-CoA transferase
VKRAPLLGEHTDEILRSVLGFSDKEVVEIEGSGAIGGMPSKDAA